MNIWNQKSDIFRIGCNFMKIIDKIVDVLLKYLMKYKTKRKIKEMSRRDPFIYH
jgi:ribosome-associated translation inhibitor RaiA